MSAETFIAYFGLRFELEAEAIEDIELRSDRRIVAARKAGLDHYWGNFGEPHEKYLLFIGHKIGVYPASSFADNARTSSAGVRSEIYTPPVLLPTPAMTSPCLSRVKGP